MSEHCRYVLLSHKKTDEWVLSEEIKWLTISPGHPGRPTCPVSPFSPWITKQMAHTSELNQMYTKPGVLFLHIPPLVLCLLGSLWLRPYHVSPVDEFAMFFNEAHENKGGYTWNNLMCYVWICSCSGFRNVSIPTSTKVKQRALTLLPMWPVFPDDPFLPSSPCRSKPQTDEWWGHRVSSWTTSTETLSSCSLFFVLQFVKRQKDCCCCFHVYVDCMRRTTTKLHRVTESFIIRLIPMSCNKEQLSI